MDGWVGRWVGRWGIIGGHVIFLSTMPHAAFRQHHRRFGGSERGGERREAHMSFAQGISSPCIFPCSSRSSRSNTDTVVSFQARSCTRQNSKKTRAPPETQIRPCNRSSTTAATHYQPNGFPIYTLEFRVISLP